ncbi:MAG: hypothetical protein M1828_000163 [Chrysothrix sp. TS-e1954]|nr:MAG: hypothetical protein M1828_000163 [Chrysothrix sp. TS-e1954]
MHTYTTADNVQYNMAAYDHTKTQLISLGFIADDDKSKSKSKSKSKTSIFKSSKRQNANRFARATRQRKDTHPPSSPVPSKESSTSHLKDRRRHPYPLEVSTDAPAWIQLPAQNEDQSKDEGITEWAILVSTANEARSRRSPRRVQQEE